jgi:hypothetical protein
MTGQQALRILESKALSAFREKHGHDMPVLVEGRVGIIESNIENGKGSAYAYMQQLHDAGATGAIVGGGLVPDEAMEALLRFSRD